MDGLAKFIGTVVIVIVVGGCILVLCVGLAGLALNSLQVIGILPIN